MGIKNFNRLLNLHCSQAHEPFSLSRLKNKNIGIDAILYLYEIKSKEKGNNKTFRMNFYEKINPILRQNPKNVFFMFDGLPPLEKSETIQKRKEEKEKLRKKYGSSHRQFIKINQLDINNYKNLIKATTNCCYMYCKDEAEAGLVNLEKKGEIDYIFSSDSDIIALGSSYIFKKNYQWIYVNNETIKSALKLSSEELLSCCIMMGTDFNQAAYRIGPITSYHYIKKYKTLENTFDNNPNVFNEKIQIRMLRSRDLFKELGEICLHNQLDSINKYIPLRNLKIKKK